MIIKIAGSHRRSFFSVFVEKDEESADFLLYNFGKCDKIKIHVCHIL